MDSLHPLMVKCRNCLAKRNVYCIEYETGEVLSTFHPERLLMAEDSTIDGSLNKLLADYIYNLYGTTSFLSSFLAKEFLSQLSGNEKNLLKVLLRDETNLGIFDLLTLVKCLEKK